MIKQRRADGAGVGVNVGVDVGVRGVRIVSEGARVYTMHAVER